MKTEVSHIESYKKSLKVHVSHEEIQPALEKAFKKYQQKVRLDGFRKGKAPLSLIKKRFGKAIEAEAVDDLVQEFYKQAVDDEKLSPVSPGKVTDVKYDEDKGLEFSAEVEVEPEITVKNYKNIKAEKEIRPIRDEDVDAMLHYLQEQHAGRTEITGGAESGSLLEADIQVLDASGFPLVGQKWEKRLIELGLPPFGQGVEDHLIGIKAGETRPVRIPAPEQGQSGSRQEDQNFSIEVHHVYQKNLPQFDDAFAKLCGEYSTLEELKNTLRESLKAQREKDTEDNLRQKISQEIVKRNDYTVPPGQVEHTLEAMLEEEQKRTRSTVDKDQFLQHHQPAVIWGIKWDRIWHKIAEMEAIDVTDEAVEAEIGRMSQISPKQENQIRARFKSPQMKNRLREHLLEERVFEFLKNEAKIKEVVVKPDQKKKSSLIT